MSTDTPAVLGTRLGRAADMVAARILAILDACPHSTHKVFGECQELNRAADWFTAFAQRWGSAPGMFALCRAMVLAVTDPELVAHPRGRYELTLPDTGGPLRTVAAQFWTAVLAGDIDNAWALFRTVEGEGGWAMAGFTVVLTRAASLVRRGVVDAVTVIRVTGDD